MKITSRQKISFKKSLQIVPIPQSMEDPGKLRSWELNEGKSKKGSNT